MVARIRNNAVPILIEPLRRIIGGLGTGILLDALRIESVAQLSSIGPGPSGRVSWSLMQGVITAIVGFIFVCLVFPSLVKNRPQYYAALGAVLVAFLFDNIAGQTPTTNGFRTFAVILDSFLIIGAIALLFMSVGGLGVAIWRGTSGKPSKLSAAAGRRKRLSSPAPARCPRMRAGEIERITLNG